MTFYSRAFSKNGDSSIHNIVTLLSVASLDDKLNGWGLQENLFQLLVSKGYSLDDATHDSRYLFLQVKHGILSTTETRGQYAFVDTHRIVPA